MVDRALTERVRTGNFQDSQVATLFSASPFVPIRLAGARGYVSWERGFALAGLRMEDNVGEVSAFTYGQMLQFGKVGLQWAIKELTRLLNGGLFFLNTES